MGIFHLLRVRLIVASVALSVIVGCGAMEYHQQSIAHQVEVIKQTRQAYEKQYLGKSKEILLKDFGKPIVHQNVLKSGYGYGDLWTYITDGNWLGVEAGGSVDFFIKEDKIEKIDVY